MSFNYNKQKLANFLNDFIKKNQMKLLIKAKHVGLIKVGWLYRGDLVCAHISKDFIKLLV
jgi:hypothetical protein